MSDYDAIADRFMAARSETVGCAIVRSWARSLERPGRVLDLGCGHGVPNARLLIDEGLAVHGVDASKRLLRAFRSLAPEATCELGRAEHVRVRPGEFDGVLVWGLIFLLTPAQQEQVIARAAQALRVGGSLLVSAPVEAGEWIDTLSGAPAESLGRALYQTLFARHGLEVVRTDADEGGNHCWWLTKP